MLKELGDIEDEKRRQIDQQIATLTNALQMLDADIFFFFVEYFYFDFFFFLLCLNFNLPVQ